MKSFLFRTKELERIDSRELPGFEIASLIDLENRAVDHWLDKMVRDNLTSVCFDHIFIPLCFGSSLVDYLGLRLAAHVRCTSGVNQQSRLWLIGTELMQFINDDPFINVLHTKNVALVDYNLQAILKAAEKKAVQLSPGELQKTLARMQLPVPANFYDQHSVANLWGMYRLLELEGIDTAKVEALSTQRRLSDIYFKWLIALDKTVEIADQEIKSVRQNYAVKLKGLTVVDKIVLPPNKKRDK